MQLIYDGPSAEVEVPLDEVRSVFAERGKPVEIPDDVAKGLLDQGHSHEEQEDGSVKAIPVDPPWRIADKPAQAPPKQAPAPKEGDA